MNAPSKDHGNTGITSNMNISDNTEDILRRVLHGDVQQHESQQAHSSSSSAVATGRRTTSVLDMILAVKKDDPSSKPQQKNTATSHMMAQELHQKLGHIRATHEGNRAMIECESLSLLLKAALNVSEECSLGTVGTMTSQHLTTSTPSSRRRNRRSHHRDHRPRIMRTRRGAALARSQQQQRLRTSTRYDSSTTRQCVEGEATPPCPNTGLGRNL